MKPDENVVEGTEQVDFAPDLATDRVVFRLWANAPRIAAGGGHIDVTMDGDHQQPDATTLVVLTPLRAGQHTHVELSWRLTLPGGIDDRISRTGDSIRLGSFFPILAWEPGVGWATEPATSGFAEASLSVASDFDVTINTPAGFEVLASGVSDRGGHYQATAVPDFAMTVGHFALATATAQGPSGPLSGEAQGPGAVAVTVGVAAGVGESPQPYLTKAVKVIEDYGRRFGAFPWPTYTLAITPNLAGGIEYPMHVMQGPGHIGRTTSHEIGHQYFYALVDSDQGRDPWIDEGMASYAEARFENTLASFVAKAMPADGKGKAGEPMTYWEPRSASYYRSVYVQGVQALAALGPPDLVDCALRQLVARQAYRVARNADVIAALSDRVPRRGQRPGPLRHQKLIDELGTSM